MKLKLFGFLLAAASVALIACNGGNQSKDSSTTAADNTGSADNAAPGSESAASQSPVHEIVGHYLHVKNALAQDNGSEAANGAKAMVASLEQVNQSAFTQEQKKVYTDVYEDLKEQAEHTAENAGNIAHQREHFVAMSNDVYDLVNAFGAGRKLYYDHCPMANDNKGANWISETQQISNPYMGKKMPKCGSVEKVIQ